MFSTYARLRNAADKFKSDATTFEAKNTNILATLQVRNDDYAKKEKDLAKLSLDFNRVQQHSREKDKKIAELERRISVPSLPTKMASVKFATTQTRGSEKKDESKSGLF
jgi:hypothetical protein